MCEVLAAGQDCPRAVPLPPVTETLYVTVVDVLETFVTVSFTVVLA